MLRHFLWYATKESWPTNAGLITEWHIRELLNYVASETNRWGLNGNGSERCQRLASYSTVHHYYATLRVFFNWSVGEGFQDQQLPFTHPRELEVAIDRVTKGWRVDDPEMKTTHPVSVEMLKRGKVVEEHPF